MIKFVLYSTDGCHLCEEAQALIQPLLKPEWRLQVVDIMNDDALLALYRTRIPVLVTPNGIALDWPFSAFQIQQIIENLNS